MSRSRRHTPIIGIACAESDAWFKAQEHRRMRAAERTALARVTGEDDDLILPPWKAYGDRWNSPKDGRKYRTTPWPGLWRK